ncbi:MAG: hypothetical protein ABIP20_10775 [Chthoniobacteraceae bacterium]
MKLPSVFLAALSAAILSAHAEVAPIRITVEPVRKTEVKKADPKNKAAASHDKTQVMSLKIQLDNNSAQALDGLMVKYWFIGHAVGEHTAKALVEGERKSSLTARGREMVDSEVVSKHYVEEHTEVVNKKATKVPASGEKIIGYAVRVLQGDKVLGEYYSDLAYKAVINSPAASAEPKPAAKPGAKPAAK